jgi:hypothetical protein
MMPSDEKSKYNVIILKSDQRKARQNITRHFLSAKILCRIFCGLKFCAPKYYATKYYAPKYYPLKHGNIPSNRNVKNLEHVCHFNDVFRIHWSYLSYAQIIFLASFAGQLDLYKDTTMARWS